MTNACNALGHVHTSYSTSGGYPRICLTCCFCVVDPDLRGYVQCVVYLEGA